MKKTKFGFKIIHLYVTTHSAVINFYKSHSENIQWFSYMKRNFKIKSCIFPISDYWQVNVLFYRDVIFGEKSFEICLYSVDIFKCMTKQIR